jgi:acyl-[acyl carrier protein]--UDP-N-acetylglucosamine O-acyltransferase
MANTLIGYSSAVDTCILDEGVTVGKFCYIGFGSVLLPGDWDITVLGKEVKVPPYTAICRKCKVMSRVGIGAFSTRLVPSGSTVV